MNLSFFGSLSKKLALLVMIAVLPPIVILLHSGIKQRQQSIQIAKNKVIQLVSTMGKAQLDIAHTTESILSTLSLLPAVQKQQANACSILFKDVLEHNPNYSNITLTDLNGDILASGKTFIKKNLFDRKHFKEAVKTQKFAVGEYILSRDVFANPILAFAYPVIDNKENLNAILTMAVKLSNFSEYHDILNLPKKSFLSITDHQGTRLSYYPAQNATNPIGKPIKAYSWQMCKDIKSPGLFLGIGSDGLKRLFAVEKIRLTQNDPPYLYVWAGIPETQIISPANANLLTNFILMLIVAIIAFVISLVIGKKTEDLIINLEKASNEIKTLQGIIPICSFCKNIRNDDGYYEQIEGYIHKHSNADFSHTVCPTCMEKHYPKEYKAIMQDKKNKIINK